MVSGIIIGLVLLLVLVLVLFVKKMMGLKTEVDAARADFMKEVGYEYASALRPSPSPSRQKNTAQGLLTHYFEIYREGSKRITVQSWELKPNAPSRIQFQLVDKKLVGSTRKLLNIVGPVQRTVQIAFPGPHLTGDAEIDARFAFFSPEPERASAVLLKPEIRETLLSLASVYLRVDESGLLFGDPSDDNVYAAGASRMDVNPTPAIRAAIHVHQTVQALLDLLAQNSAR